MIIPKSCLYELIKISRCLARKIVFGHGALGEFAIFLNRKHDDSLASLYLLFTDFHLTP